MWFISNFDRSFYSWEGTTKIQNEENSRWIYGYLNVKIKMGVEGLIFEPRPPSFENQYNFWRCLNDFLVHLLVSDFQRSVWSVQSISVACSWFSRQSKSNEGFNTINITMVQPFWVKSNIPWIIIKKTLLRFDAHKFFRDFRGMLLI